MFHTKPDGTEHTDNKDFYMEDYFPVDVYKDEILNDVKAKSSFKQFDQLKSPKTIIEKTFEHLTALQYDAFRSLLDKTISIQKAFHSVSSLQKKASSKRTDAKKPAAKRTPKKSV